MPMPRPHRPQHRASHPAMRLIAAGLAMSALALAGCADRPAATGFLPSAQQHLQSAGHWAVVADDVASAVSAYLTRQATPADLAQPVPPPAPVSVMMIRGNGTVFADAFLSSLRTRFVQLGHPVATAAREGTVLIGIDMMLIRNQPGSRRAWTSPGPLTALAGGAAVGSYLLDTFPWAVTAIPLGLGTDAVLSKPPETDTEMMLTVSIERDGFHIFRSSAVYYINTRDIGHYEGLGGFAVRSLNEVPQGAIAYDIAGKPYVMREPR